MRADWALVKMADRNSKSLARRRSQLLGLTDFSWVEVDMSVEIAN